MGRYVLSARSYAGSILKPISVYNQPRRSAQPGRPSVDRRNEYQPKGGDALRLGSKVRYMVRVWVAGKTV